MVESLRRLSELYIIIYIYILYRFIVSSTLSGLKVLFGRDLCKLLYYTCIHDARKKVFPKIVEELRFRVLLLLRTPFYEPVESA